MAGRRLGALEAPFQCIPLVAVLVAKRERTTNGKGEDAGVRAWGNVRGGGGARATEEHAVKVKCGMRCRGAGAGPRGGPLPRGP